MKKYLEYALIILILATAFALRLFKVSSDPPGLSNDEISIASEAYSIINTGRDTYNNLLPLSFRSHGDYKAPLYIYIAGPFIKLLGNSELAVRLPSVIFGTLTILGIYLLCKELGLSKNKSIISAFLLAITPWNVYTSRIASESNLALFFLVFGIFLFLKTIKKRWALIPAFVFLSLSLYSYHTELVLTPLIFSILSLIYYKEFKNKKDIGRIWLGFIILLIPFFINVLFLKGGTRASNEFLINDYLLANQLANVGNFFTKAYIIIVFWFDKYLQYLSLPYLFGHGLQVNSFYNAPYFGLINIAELPFFLLGLFFLLKFKNIKRDLTILFWLLLAPLTPSLTLGDLNLMRNLPIVIPVTIIVTEGIDYISRKINFKHLTLIIVTILISVNFIVFYRYYIKYFPIYYSENWSYGFKELSLYAKNNQDKYQKIVFDYHYGVSSDLYSAPSLFILYFGRYDPISYQQISENNEFRKFGKYEFRQVNWTVEKIEPNILYIVGVRTVPLYYQNVREVYSVNLLDGQKAFVVYESY